MRSRPRSAPLAAELPVVRSEAAGSQAVRSPVGRAAPVTVNVPLRPDVCPAARDDPGLGRFVRVALPDQSDLSIPSAVPGCSPPTVALVKVTRSPGWAPPSVPNPCECRRTRMGSARTRTSGGVAVAGGAVAGIWVAGGVVAGGAVGAATAARLMVLDPWMTALTSGTCASARLRNDVVDRNKDRPFANPFATARPAARVTLRLNRASQPILPIQFLPTRRSRYWPYVGDLGEGTRRRPGTPAPPRPWA